MEMRHLSRTIWCGFIYTGTVCRIYDAKSSDAAPISALIAAYSGQFDAAAHIGQRRIAPHPGEGAALQRGTLKGSEPRRVTTTPTRSAAPLPEGRTAQPSAAATTAARTGEAAPSHLLRRLPGGSSRSPTARRPSALAPRHRSIAGAPSVATRGAVISGGRLPLTRPHPTTAARSGKRHRSIAAAALWRSPRPAAPCRDGAK